MKKKFLSMMGLLLLAGFATAQHAGSQPLSPTAGSDVATLSATGEVTHSTLQVRPRRGKTLPIFSTSFAADDAAISFGVVSSDESFNDFFAPQHTQTAAHSYWRRIADTSLSYYNSQLYSIYPSFSSSWARYAGNFVSESVSDGFIMMSMQDQIAAWGGTGNVGSFDAFVSFPGFSTTGVGGIVVHLYQLYRCFNADRCFIDYSLDSSSWQSVELNVRNVDVASNGTLLGLCEVALPTTLGNQSHVYLRLRWTSNSSNGGAYGYFWMVDDFTVEAMPAYQMATLENAFFGAYSMIPQGFKVPLTYGSYISSRGQNGLSDVTATVAHGSQVLGSNNIGFVSSNAGNTPVVVDASGFYGNGGANTPDRQPSYRGFAYGAGTLGVFAAGGGFYPSATLGVDSVQAYTVSADGSSSDTLNFRYTVNGGNGGTWAYDDGTLVPNNSATFGFTWDGLRSTDPSSNGCLDNGYSMYLSYRTGDSIPADWVVYGMEMVAAHDGNNVTGTVIKPIFTIDSVNVTDDEYFVFFTHIPTGALHHTITADELNIDLSGELAYGTYNSIYIPFPEQPNLLPNACYRVGYQLENNAAFVPALSVGNAVTRHSYYDLRVGANGTAGWYGDELVSQTPMIRLRIGPRQAMTRHQVSFVGPSDFYIYGYINDGAAAYLSLADVDSLAEGSTKGYTIYPNQRNKYVSRVLVNGEEVNFTTAYFEGDDGERSSAYIEVTMGQEDLVISFEVSTSCEAPSVAVSTLTCDTVYFSVSNPNSDGEQPMMQYRTSGSATWVDGGYETYLTGRTPGERLYVRYGLPCVDDTLWSDTLDVTVPLRVAPTIEVVNLTSSSAAVQVYTNGGGGRYEWRYAPATNPTHGTVVQSIKNSDFVKDITNVVDGVPYVAKVGLICGDTILWSNEVQFTPWDGVSPVQVQVYESDGTTLVTQWPVYAVAGNVENDASNPSSSVLYMYLMNQQGSFPYVAISAQATAGDQSAAVEYGVERQAEIDGLYHGDWWSTSATLHLNETPTAGTPISGSLHATIYRAVDVNGEMTDSSSAPRRILNVTFSHVVLTGNWTTPTLPPVTLTAVSNDVAKGGVSGGGTFSVGYEATLYAYAYAGNQFVGWSNGAVDNPLRLTADSNLSLTAIFASSEGGTTVVHDTTSITIRDTVSVAVHDTVSVTVHDTLTVQLPGDTVFVGTDTVTLVTYDTIFVAGDTVYLGTDSVYTWSITSSNASQGVVVGSGSYFAGQHIGIAALPAEGFRFDAWSDGNTDNPRSLTVSGDLTLSASFVGLTGVEELTLTRAEVWSNRDCIHVRGAEGMSIYVYDEWGRCLSSTSMNTDTEKIYRMPAAGTYIVKVGTEPARKVVVVR